MRRSSQYKCKYRELFKDSKEEVASGKVSAADKVDELIRRGYIKSDKRELAIADFKQYEPKLSESNVDANGYRTDRYQGSREQAIINFYRNRRTR